MAKNNLLNIYLFTAKGIPENFLINRITAENKYRIAIANSQFQH
ncbi:hypothetical protein PT2222_160030 [Paraburkholderia tropica]